MNILDKFVKVTNYDLHQYFVDYDYFLNNYLNSLVAYYNGTASLNKMAFSELIRLTKESSKIEFIISASNTNLSDTTEFWDLIDNLSDVKVKLETVMNLAKWMRASYVYGYEAQSKVAYILKQNETFENLSNELGSVDPNEDWVDITLSNGVMELDYTKQGGNILSINKTNNTSQNVTTVVDVMVGDNILGKDLPKKIEITSEDITALNTADTMNQSAEICLTVTKGSVPEFFNLGIDKSFVGSTISALRLPSLMRDVYNNFKTDDSFRSVEMVDNGVNQDVAFYNFDIISRLNNQLNKTL